MAYGLLGGAVCGMLRGPGADVRLRSITMSTALNHNLFIQHIVQRMKWSATALLADHQHLGSDTQGDFIGGLGSQLDSSGSCS